jgi:ureidoglycolate lyase
MKTIRCSGLEGGRFARYGYTANLLRPEGEKIRSDSAIFFRDMIPLGSLKAAAASVCQLGRRAMIVTGAEYHSSCGEVIVPLDGDIIIPVAPALPAGSSPVDHFEAFHLKRGTLVYLRQGVWHSAAFPVDCEVVNLLIILPERTYANDCHVLSFGEAERIRIEPA